NFVNILIQMAGTAMLAFGVVFVLLLGEIDLSISYVAGIGAVAAAELQRPASGHQINGLLAMLAAIAICVVIGLGQGTIIARVRVSNERFGLAVAKVIGVAIAAFGAVAICNHASVQGTPLGLPLAGVLVVLFLVGLTFLAKRTIFGRHVYAVGGNAEAARRAG